MKKDLNYNLGLKQDSELRDCCIIKSRKTYLQFSKKKALTRLFQLNMYIRQCNGILILSEYVINRQLHKLF